VHGLPEEEAAHPLLPGGADDEIGIGLAGGVEVVGDVVDGQHVRRLLHRDALAGHLTQEGTHRVGDLMAAAVPDRHVDVEALGDDEGVAGLGGGESVRDLAREEVEGADDVEAPPAVVGELVHHGEDDPHQVGDLVRVAFEVVGGEHPQRHAGHARLGGPLEERGDVVRARPVPLRDRRAHRARPAAVAVQHHGDVPRHPHRIEVAGEVAFVERVQQVGGTHRDPLHRWKNLCNAIANATPRSGARAWLAGTR